MTALGFGRGNLQDHNLEQYADQGNGSYHFVDSTQEGERVMDSLIFGAMQIIAKDVKIQVEVNTEIVRSYRRLGYENREIADADFRNDAVDAGEVGAGESVTALIELQLHDGVASGPSDAELFTVRVRYKDHDGVEATEIAESFAVSEMGSDAARASGAFRFAVAVAELGEILRGSEYSDGARFDDLEDMARDAFAAPDRYHREFLELASTAQRLFEARAAR